MNKTFVDMRPLKPSTFWPALPGHEDRAQDFDRAAASNHVFIVDAVTSKYLFDMSNGVGVAGFGSRLADLARNVRFPFHEMVADYDCSNIDEDEDSRFITFIRGPRLFSAVANGGKLQPVPFFIDLSADIEPGNLPVGTAFMNANIARVFKDGAGDYLLKMMPSIPMTFLLMLAFDSGFVGFERVPARSFMKGNKRVAVPATTSVTIRLWEKTRRSIIKSLEHGHHSSPRLHDVRGHWMHYDLIEHEHEWVDTPSADGKIRQVCSCGARRTWRSEFERGDASKGSVSKVYKVRG